MKTLLCIALTVLAVASPAFAFAQACDKIEYAKLKDSTPDELNTQYCRAMQRSKQTQGDARTSCLRVAEDVTDMLTKKFKQAQQYHIYFMLDQRAHLYAVQVRNAREIAGVGRGRKFRREYVGPGIIEDAASVEQYREQLESELPKEITPPACPQK